MFSNATEAFPGRLRREMRKAAEHLRASSLAALSVVVATGSEKSALKALHRIRAMPTLTAEGLKVVVGRLQPSGEQKIFHPLETLVFGPAGESSGEE